MIQASLGFNLKPRSPRTHYHEAAHGQTTSLERLIQFLHNVQVIQKACSTPEGVWSAMRAFSNVPFFCDVLLAYFGTTSPSLVQFPSTPITLSIYFNNQAASVDGTSGNFNKYGSTYAAEYLPTGPWLFDGVTVNHFIVLSSEWLNAYF